MKRAMQLGLILALGSLSAACGASRQPVETSTPAESNAEPAMSGTSEDEHDATGSASPDAEPSMADVAPSEPSKDVVEAERAAYERARPVFQEYCAKCHTSASPRAKPGALKHFNMDTYPFGGHHAAQIAAAVREVLGATGEEATMPADTPGAVTGEQLSLVMAWADAFDRAHSAPAGTANREMTSDGR